MENLITSGPDLDLHCFLKMDTSGFRRALQVQTRK